MQAHNHLGVGGASGQRRAGTLLAVAVVIGVGSPSTSSLAQGGGSSARPAAQSGQAVSPSSSQWNTFVADITVRVSRVKPDGTPEGVPMAPMQYRWERSQSGAGWKTVMTIAEQPLMVDSADTRQRVTNPSMVARIEDDEDGSPLRMYGWNGQLLQPVSAEQLQQWTEAGVRKLGPDAAAVFQDIHPPADKPAPPSPPRRLVESAERDWIAGLVATPEERGSRRALLAQQFVRAGQVRGLDRFTRLDGTTTHEVLADPQSAVPIEVNTARDGHLLLHSTISYQPGADGSLVRGVVHVEQLLSPAGDRSITDTEYANVHVERRR